MGKVILDMSMSLDGLIAQPNDKTGPLHSWLFNGKTTSRYSNEFKTSGRSTDVLDEIFSSTGAMIAGRRTFDLVQARIVNRPMEVPYFIVTHNPPDKPTVDMMNFTFVTNGVEDAINQARAAAGDKNILVIGGANIARQCIEAGLLHEIQIHMAPILLKEGISLFGHLSPEQVKLETTRVIEAPGVIHLKFRVL